MTVGTEVRQLDGGGEAGAAGADDAVGRDAVEGQAGPSVAGRFGGCVWRMGMTGCRLSVNDYD